MNTSSSMAPTDLAQPPGRAVIVGLGKTGLSVARFLSAQGWSLTVTDSREEPQGVAELLQLAPDTPMYFGAAEAQILAGAKGLAEASLVVASPGVSPANTVLRAARDRGLAVVGDIELFARARRARALTAPVAGITGTNGKSTVTALVGDMAAKAGLRVAVGGNIGTPALDLLSTADSEMFVLELSSFQLDGTQALPLRVAAVLNLAEDHLDRYENMAAYTASKARIFEHADCAIVNADDPWVASMPVTGRRVTFSLTSQADYRLEQASSGAWLLARGERVLAVADMKLIGRHNEANALAALAIGDALGLPRSAMQASLKNFAGLPHRMEWVAERAGVRYVNDSKGTNVGATLAAVAGLAQPLVLIAGGDGKGQDFSPLVAALRDRARLVVLIGRDAPKIAEALSGSVPTRCVANIEEAVTVAAATALPGDTVLLSPACSSLDMFRDYAQRGEIFRDCVLRGLA